MLDAPRSRRVWKAFSFLCASAAAVFLSSDSVDVDSLGQDSSDEEEEEEEEGRVARVTSIDEALRTVTGAADRSQEAFLKRNFETLAESCSSGRRGQTLTCNFKGIVEMNTLHHKMLIYPFN